MNQRFVEYVRGPLVESVHYGSAAVVAADGRLVSSAGDAGLVSYYRSAAKPLQAVPLIESGAADHFGLTEAEIAVVCGSHGGEDIHIAAVVSILSKIGVSPDALRCGVQIPFDRQAAHARAAAGLAPDQLCNNCSGKHAGMLALCVFNGWGLENYFDITHPVQQLMLQTIADFCGLQTDEIFTGIDGCSVVCFGVSTYHMALSFARLAQPPDNWSAARREACRRVVAAMVAHPEMVAARQNRIDTDLMRAYDGQLIAKAGAEAVYCMAVLPGVNGAGLGLALKLIDGDEHGRARDPAVLGLLQEANLLDDAKRAQLAKYIDPPLTNRAGLTVGEIRATLKLHPHQPGVHIA